MSLNRYQQIICKKVSEDTAIGIVQINELLYNMQTDGHHIIDVTKDRNSYLIRYQVGEDVQPIKESIEESREE